jgi:hypothetical protein
MSTDLSKLVINKPKKSNGTYVCYIDQPFKLVLNNAQLIYLKTNTDDSQFIFLKNKQLYDYLCDLNDSIITIVKQNCGNWFNTNMSPDVIDDYYTNTLVYDKTHGDLIKLKITGEDKISKDLLNQKLNITLTANNLRFYKQKFVLETLLDSHEITCDIIDFPSDEENEDVLSEDEPYPSASELEEMRNDIIKHSNTELDLINTEISKLQEKKLTLENYKDLKDPDDIIKLYNSFMQV